MSWHMAALDDTGYIQGHRWTPKSLQRRLLAKVLESNLKHVNQLRQRGTFCFSVQREIIRTRRQIEKRNDPRRVRIVWTHVTESHWAIASKTSDDSNYWRLWTLVRDGNTLNRQRGMFIQVYNHVLRSTWYATIGKDTRAMSKYT